MIKMEKDYIYLTYYQMMAFVEKIEQMKLQNQFFNDEFASMFENQFLNMSYQNALIPNIIKKIIPNAGKFKISISLFNYLERLTNVNVNDKKFMREFTKKRIKKDKEFVSSFINGDYKIQSDKKR